MLPHYVSPFLLQFSIGVCSDVVHGLAVFEVVARGKYQQAVKQTLGVASSMWVQNTGAQPLALVDVTPAQVEKKDKESMQGENCTNGYCSGQAALQRGWSFCFGKRENWRLATAFYVEELLRLGGIDKIPLL